MAVDIAFFCQKLSDINTANILNIRGRPPSTGVVLQLIVLTRTTAEGYGANLARDSQIVVLLCVGFFLINVGNRLD
jgi:hypothetical protein